MLPEFWHHVTISLIEFLAGWLRLQQKAHDGLFKWCEIKSRMSV